MYTVECMWDWKRIKTHHSMANKLKREAYKRIAHRQQRIIKKNERRKKLEKKFISTQSKGKTWAKQQNAAKLKYLRYQDLCCCHFDAWERQRMLSRNFIEFYMLFLKNHCMNVCLAYPSCFIRIKNMLLLLYLTLFSMRKICSQSYTTHVQVVCLFGVSSFCFVLFSFSCIFIL